MGGYGSGRKFGANCAEDYQCIDIRRWQRECLLRPGCSFNTEWFRNGEKIAEIAVKLETGQLRLIYSTRQNGGDWEPLDYPVRLQTTACHYGGIRYWFTCPANGCGRRVAKLYAGGKYFACRHCYQLAYQSQRETKGDRGYRGAGKIREKLGWEPGISNPPGEKPKGMHWKTYCRLLAKHTDYSNDAYMGMLAIFRNVNTQFAAIQQQYDLD